MSKWLVIYYDGNHNRAALVTDNIQLLPYGCEGDPALNKALGCEEVQINAVIEVPDDYDGIVVIEDEATSPKEVEISAEC